MGVVHWLGTELQTPPSRFDCDHPLASRTRKPVENVTCIYCSSLGPFTDEHVVPAGLGGDDRGWLLKDVVCAVCNTKVFSPLETKVMRSSPLAMARLFLQSRSRGRGAKTATPSIQAPVGYFADPDSGLLLEQELGHRGQSTIHPQVIVVPPNMISVTGTDVASVNELVAELGALADVLTICEKTRDGLEVRFQLTPLKWDGHRYLAGTASGEAKAPRDAIWLEPLERPATKPSGLLTPRAFRRAKGPMVCRAGNVEDAARLLGFIRTNSDALVVPAGTKTKVTETPGIHLRQNMDGVAYNRVLTKIAFNLCAHLFGADAVRAPAFDAARDYARLGTGRTKELPDDLAKQLADRYPRLPHHHLMIVKGDPPVTGRAGHLTVFMQFYGGLFHAAVVAEGTAGIPAPPDETYVVVDYEANAISRFTSGDFARFVLASVAVLPGLDEMADDA